MQNKALFLMVFLWAMQLCADPLLVVALMVKDEALVIKQTLQPFIDGGITDFVIFDTGSTDGTQQVVADFFKQYTAVQGHVIEELFIDFATSRNHALEAVSNIFPNATFILMPDAEWYMHNIQGLRLFCNQNKYDCQMSYLVSIKNATSSFYTPRLLRCNSGIQFVGCVHEVPNHVTRVKLPDDIYFEWRPTQKGQSKTAWRWQRDRDLLLKEYEKNPFDARTLFYLAQTYECLSDWENAHIFYEKRSFINGWDEENYMTLYRLGNVAWHRIAKDSQGLCPDLVTYYLKAFAMRPQRAEPLIQIAWYYLSKKNMHVAYLFAARAVQIPYPENDILLVDKSLYDFMRYNILSKCAWSIGEYEVSKEAMRKILDSDYFLMRID